MNTPFIAVLCSATFGVALAGAHALLTPPRAHASSTDDTVPASLRPAERDALEALRADFAALSERVAQVESTAPAVTRVDQAALDAAVRRALADASSALVATDEDATPDDAGPRPVAELVAEVLAASDLERASLWRSLTQDGRAEEVLAALRARAEADPNDPEKQLELGQAYIARIAEVGNSPLAGTYALQADAAFDRALAADPEHYAARFNKAVALSFWPPVFGKQGAAIQQFELLLAQQARRTPEPGFAETHLLLGNLYEQTGQRDKAVAAWRQGAALFPDHAGLAQQLSLAGQGQ